MTGFVPEAARSEAGSDSGGKVTGLGGLAELVADILARSVNVPKPGLRTRG
jgi:hypothetical protein